MGQAVSTALNPKSNGLLNAFESYEPDYVYMV